MHPPSTPPPPPLAPSDDEVSTVLIASVSVASIVVMGAAIVLVRARVAADEEMPHIKLSDYEDPIPDTSAGRRLSFRFSDDV
jgi:hypothetical protein